MIDYSTFKFAHSTKEEFFTMLLINSLRGAHSTGVLGVRQDQKAEYIKAVGDPWTLWGYKEYDTFADRIVQKYTALLGHGRMSTRGTTNARNAHPHQRSHIHLIHNGTISNFDYLKKEYSQANFEVDSDLCANMIAKEGIEETAKQLVGSFAFIWYDSELDLVRAFRNDDRPLWLFHRKNKSQYLLASDPAIFDYMKSKYIFSGDVISLESSMLYSFNFKNDDIEQKKLDLYKYKFAQIDEVRRQYWGGGEFDDDWDGRNNFGKIPFQEAANTAYQSVPTTVKTAKSSILTRSFTSGETKWKVGERVNFIPNAATTKTIVWTGEIYNIIRGTVARAPNIEVTGIWKNDLMDIADKGVLVGTIKSIMVLDISETFSARMYVDNIEPFAILLPEEVEALDSPNNKNFIVLADNTQMAKHRFEELAKKNCGTCKGEVKQEDSLSSIVIENQLYCSVCVSKGEYPKDV